MKTAGDVMREVRLLLASRLAEVRASLLATRDAYERAGLNLLAAFSAASREIETREDEIHAVATLLALYAFEDCHLPLDLDLPAPPPPEGGTDEQA